MSDLSSELSDTVPFSPDTLLQQFAANTMAVDELVVEMCGAEQALLATVKAKAAQTKADTTDVALALAGPRVQALVRAHERLGRCLRLTLGLIKRFEAGWPASGVSDDRRAMKRRQVTRALREQVGAEGPEGAEREQLLAELRERLWEPDIEAMLESEPAEAIIARIGEELATVRQDVAAIPPAPAEVADPWQMGPTYEEAIALREPPPAIEPAAGRKTKAQLRAEWDETAAIELWRKRFHRRHGFMPEDLPGMRQLE